jgi:nucleoside-diphosphate-sugar epimerase
MPRRVPDIQKIGRQIGWQPTIGLAQILDDVIDSFRQHH